MDHSQHSIGQDGLSSHSHDHLHHTTPASTDVHSHDHGSHNMGDHSVHSGHGGMHHMMSMAFHFGCDETVLFSFWKIDTIQGLIGSMVAIFIMATLYEGLKYYREYLFWKTYNLLEYRPVSMPTEKGLASTEENRPPGGVGGGGPVHYVGEVIHKQPPSMLSWMHFYQTFLHIIQVSVSFLLMLIFMTYNVWLCIAVVLGAATGYFLFCWKKSVIVDVTEHCH